MEKNFEFCEADRQTGSATDSMGGSVAPDETYRTVKKTVPIGSEMAEISRVKEIRLVPLVAKPEPLATDGAWNSVGGHGATMPESMATVCLQTAPHDVTQFFMKTHRKPFDNYARLQKD